MKILHINCVYRKGSTGKIVADIHDTLLSYGEQCVICYGRGDLIKEPHVYKICKEFEANIHTAVIRSGIILNYGGLLFPTYRLFTVIRSETPDIVHIHCANGSTVNIYRLLKYLHSNHIKTVVTHHAEIYYTGGCEHAYECLEFTSNNGCHDCPRKFQATRSKTWDNSNRAWKSMRNAINLFCQEDIIFTAVSPWLKQRSLLSPIVNRYKCKTIMNGIDTSIFSNQNGKNIIKDRVPNCKDLIILHVSASFSSTEKEGNKGGWYTVELAKRMPNVQFVVACLRSQIDSILPDNLYIWGAAKNQAELSSLYNSSNLTLIVSKRETFSMICAESLCCGTPVLGFKAGGPESISIPEYSSFVNYADMDALQTEAIRMLGIPYNEVIISSEAKKLYSKETMTDGYIKIYKQLLEK